MVPGQTLSQQRGSLLNRLCLFSINFRRSNKCSKCKDGVTPFGCDPVRKFVFFWHKNAEDSDSLLLFACILFCLCAAEQLSEEYFVDELCLDAS